MAVISIQHLMKGFTDGASKSIISVFSDVSLTVEGPAIVSIVGPNGVGKTTFLRLLAGVIQPDGGRVLIDGGVRSHCRIGYVPQDNPVFPWRRVEDDIAIPLEISRMPRKERHRHVMLLVKRFSFDLPLNRRSHGLSGGQRQLVNICRALVGPEPPKVLLLDEPFGALDVTAREEFLSYIQDIYSEFKPLILMTTHHLDLAVLAADLIIPFQNRPVTCSDDETIVVSIPRPRSGNLRATPHFQELLSVVERVFRQPGHLAKLQ